MFGAFRNLRRAESTWGIAVNVACVNSCIFQTAPADYKGIEPRSDFWRDAAAARKCKC
jgi:hypothetical protein